jgi:hypothetical protein
VYIDLETISRSHAAWKSGEIVKYFSRGKSWFLFLMNVKETAEKIKFRSISAYKKAPSWFSTQ